MTATRRNLLQAVEWALLLSGLLAMTVTEQYRWYVSAGLGLMLLAWVARGWRTGQWLEKTGMEAPMGLFLVSAGAAAWFSYDPSAAWLQWVRCLAGVMLFMAVAEVERGWRGWIAAGFVLAVMGLAVYWPLQHDFTGGQSKFAIIDTVGAWLNSVLPTIPGPSIQSNVAAGTLVMGVPVGAACAWEAGKRRRWWLAGLMLLCTLVIAAALMLTSSRGAWVALGGVSVLTGMVWLQRRLLPGRGARRWFWLVSGGVGLALAAGLWASGLGERALGQVPDPTGTMQGRMGLWRQGAGLIEDYALTGSGLMAFRMVYATYGILIHVPLHDHLHNTYLEVWLEQGVLGVIALAWGLLVAGGWAWGALGRKQTSIWGWAGLAAVAAVCIHGVFDVVFYVTRTLPLIGLAAGLAFYAGEGAAAQAGDRRRRGWLAVGILAAMVVGGVVWLRPLMGMVYANLGALEQTRLELTTYDASHFDNPTLDEVRRELDLSRSVGYFERALAYDEGNGTALRRLAAIGLSRGEYEQALGWMERAWERGRRDETTRLLYGDALVAAGRPGEAAEVVKGVSGAAGRLAFQAWYRYERLGDEERSAWAWEAVEALKP